MFRRLLLLNGFAAIAIPLHHASAYGLLALFEWTDRYRPVEVPNFDLLGSPPYYIMMIIRLLMSFAVPSFLFASGFFVAFMARGKISRLNVNMVLPRIKILLIPFILWTVFRFVLTRRLPYDLNDLLDPYHYIPLVIQFYLLSPLIVPLAKRRWGLLLLVAAFFHIGLFTYRYFNTLGLVIPGQEQILSTIPRWLFISQAFWFPFGVVFGLHLESLTPKLEKLKWVLLGAVIVFGVAGIIEYQIADQLNGEQWLGPVFGGIFSRLLYAPAFILCVLAFNDRSIPHSKEISQISTKSLGIYLVNIPAIFTIASIMYRLTPWLLGLHFIYLMVLMAAGLGGPLLLMEIIRKSPMRRGYRLLFG